MYIITLTTDFGLQDYYVPVLKGTMLQRHQALNFIDISHNIKNHDIVQAAFTLKNAWHQFPEETIHLVSVNNFGGERNRFLVLHHQNHFFIGPDNGIFTLLFDTPPQYIYEIPFQGLNFQHVKEAFADAIDVIVSEKPLAEMWSPVTDMVQRITLQPVIAPSQIRGSVIHIDNYDNVIINVTRALFEKVGRGRNFQLYFKLFIKVTPQYLIDFQRFMSVYQCLNVL